MEKITACAYNIIWRRLTTMEGLLLVVYYNLLE